MIVCVWVSRVPFDKKGQRGREAERETRRDDDVSFEETSFSLKTFHESVHTQEYTCTHEMKLIELSLI